MTDPRLATEAGFGLTEALFAAGFTYIGAKAYGVRNAATWALASGALTSAYSLSQSPATREGVLQKAAGGSAALGFDPLAGGI